MPITVGTQSGADWRKAISDAGSNTMDAMSLSDQLAWLDATITDLKVRQALKFLARQQAMEKNRLTRFMGAVTDWVKHLR